MFTLEELEQFAAFAEAGTLSQAAEKLHISQPTITRTMQHLEECFKVPLFVSGKNRQVSCASQIWMVLAEVVVGKEAKLLLERMDRMDPIVRPVTPYLHHHLLEAYSVAGAEERMRAHLLRYWGAMVRKGMNVFPEVFVEDQEFLTPYGRDPRINSACHAWSCAPAYFLRRGR